MLGTTHPGETLREELEARRMTATALAQKLRLPPQRLQEIVRGQRAVTPETALRLSHYFGNEAEFWLNLQSQHDLAMVRQTKGREIAAEVEQAA